MRNNAVSCGGISRCLHARDAESGINGSKITFITYDDAYSPPKAIEQARKLVQGDEVL
jgi:ABC-type branched-subunit amino acid transport system substrate-binding protein